MNRNCPVCGSNQFYPFLERDSVPIFQNIVISDQTLASRFRDGRMALTACPQCHYIYNEAFDASKMVYNQAYDNCQLYSTYFDEYMIGLVNYLLEEYKIRNSRILEIGCGQGEFLRRLVEKPEYKNCGVGFDPSYRGEDTLFGGRLEFCRSYFDETSVNSQADVIICRHVIEHMSNPVALLKTIRRSIGKKKVLLFFETPYVNWILRKRVFWDFFYEHCSYFNEDSIQTAFLNAGFSIRNIKHIFKSQYLWIEGGVDLNCNKSDAPSQDSWLKFKCEIDDYVKDEKRMMMTWHNNITSLIKKKNVVAIWGAGAKGVTFANLIDQDRSLIDCVIDINPNKQGNYLPGTGHIITDIETARQRGVTHVIIMNPNYFSEMQRLLIDKKVNIQLIRITDM